MAYRGYSDAQNEATKRYFAKLKNLSVRMQPEEYDRYKSIAERLKMPLRQYVLAALDEYADNHITNYKDTI